MGLMNLFRKAKPEEELPNAVDYVEWLLMHMLRTSCTELVIDTSRALPGSIPAGEYEPPPLIPPATTVINRLKIISNVNPVRPEGGRAMGSFERCRTHHTVKFTTQFEDGIDKSTCIIRLTIRCVNP